MASTIRAAGCLVVILLPLAGPAEASVVQGTSVIDGYTYDTWRDPAQTYQIVCEQPCPIPTELILLKYDGFAVAKAQLVTLFGIDVIPARAPVDLHLASDSWCGPYPTANGSSGSASNYPLGVTTSLRGYTCTFEHDKQMLGELAVPFTVPEAGTIEAQLLVVHEYGHVIFSGRHSNKMEEWVRYASFHVSGSPPLTDPCDPYFNLTAKWVYNLCQQDGLAAADMAPAFVAMDQVYQGGLGYYDDGRTSVFQLRQILDAQLASATLDVYLGLAFHPVTAGDAVTILPAGDTYMLGGGLLGVRVYPGAVAAPTPVKLEHPGSAPSIPGLDFDWLFDLVPADHTESTPATPVQFASAVRLAVLPDPAWYPAGTDLSSLRLFQVVDTPSGQAWRRVRASWEQGGTVFADVWRTGTFGVFPVAP